MTEDRTPKEREIENTAEETRPVTGERPKTIERIVEISKTSKVFNLRLG